MDKPTGNIAVYLIVNGSLGMSAGKTAAQAFQACQRLLHASQQSGCPIRCQESLRAWEIQGTRTITRIAQTEHIFERACRELRGVLMIDEGMTEVPPGSPTIFATWPVRRDALPRMLRHKRIPLMRDSCPLVSEIT